MPQPLTLRQELSDRVYVEDGLFWINACDLDNVGGIDDIEPTEFVSVNADRNAVLVTSAAQDLEASVTMTAWSSEPHPPHGDWDEVAELDLRLSSGRIRLAGLMGTESTVFLAAGDPGESVSARLYGRGRRTAAEAEIAAALAGQEPTGLEHYHLQVWSVPEPQVRTPTNPRR